MEPILGVIFQTVLTCQSGSISTMWPAHTVLHPSPNNWLTSGRTGHRRGTKQGPRDTTSPSFSLLSPSTGPNLPPPIIQTLVTSGQLWDLSPHCTSHPSSWPPSFILVVRAAGPKSRTGEGVYVSPGDGCRQRAGDKLKNQTDTKQELDREIRESNRKNHRHSCFIIPNFVPLWVHGII